MRQAHRMWLVAVGILLASPALAGQRISGVVFTESKAEKVTVRAWALGQPLLAKPTLAAVPLVEVIAAPAKPFTLELPDEALPVRVEVAAPGHLGAAFTVALPDQATLPPLWLPVGRELRLSVLMDNKPAAGAHVWGSLKGVNRVVDDAGRWQPVVPATEVDGKGQAKAWVPGQGTLTLSGRAPDGRWGTLPPIRLPTQGMRVLRLDSRPTTVVVRNPRGEPAAGRGGGTGRAPGERDRSHSGLDVQRCTLPPADHGGRRHSQQRARIQHGEIRRHDRHCAWSLGCGVAAPGYVQHRGTVQSL